MKVLKTYTFKKFCRNDRY